MAKIPSFKLNHTRRTNESVAKPVTYVSVATLLGDAQVNLDKVARADVKPDATCS